MSSVEISADGRRQRRLRNILLNRRFQLKYTAMIVGIASLISLVLGVFLMSTVRENSRMLKLEAEFDDVLQAQLADADAHIVWVLVGAFILFNLVLALIAVFITHRMAGPIFVVRRHIAAIGEGRLPRVRKLRKGDEFVELVDTLTQAITNIAVRTREEAAVIERVLGVLGDGKEDVRQELTTLLEGKRSMLAKLEE
jgi:hypothetical protein